MGVYIKGMYMPPSCYFCPMTNDGFYLCKANNPYRQLEDDCEECKPQWCPLVPAPPHGDLIDRDALIRDWPTGFVKTADVINNTPTIIPADPTEEG